MSFWDIASTYSNDLLGGLKVTLYLNLIVWGFGIVVGTGLGIAAARWRSVGSATKLLALLLIGTPFLVLLFWMHYPFQILIGLVIPPFVTAALTLGTVNVLLVADLVRGVLADFPRHYIAVGKVCGLGRRRLILSIQLPIALRQLLPRVLLVQIVMLHASLFASLISVDEVFRVAQRINSRIYRPVEIYTLLAGLFLLATLPLYGVAAWLRKKYTRDLSER